MDFAEMIRREMKRKNINNVELARRLRVSPAAIPAMLNSPTMQVTKLARLSEIFEYNFFREIARTLPFAEPEYEPKVDENAIKAPLLERIKTLEMEVDILRRTLKDAVSR